MPCAHAWEWRAPGPQMGIGTGGGMGGGTIGHWGVATIDMPVPPAGPGGMFMDPPKRCSFRGDKV